MINMEDKEYFKKELQLRDKEIDLAYELYVNILNFKMV